MNIQLVSSSAEGCDVQLVDYSRRILEFFSPYWYPLFHLILLFCTLESLIRAEQTSVKELRNQKGPSCFLLSHWLVWESLSITMVGNNNNNKKIY